MVCLGDKVEPSTVNSKNASFGMTVKGFTFPSIVLIIPLFTVTSKFSDHTGSPPSAELYNLKSIS